MLQGEEVGIRIPCSCRESITDLMPPLVIFEIGYCGTSREGSVFVILNMKHTHTHTPRIIRMRGPQSVW